jgi:hypothetical protein
MSCAGAWGNGQGPGGEIDANDGVIAAESLCFSACVSPTPRHLLEGCQHLIHRAVAR